MDIIKRYIQTIDFKNVRTNPPPELIFLCGGSAVDAGFFRQKFGNKLITQGHNVILAEKAMDWQGGQMFSKDLLELEKYYAALVSIIPLICESYGSACELGAFVSDPLIRRKLFIIISEKFYIGEESNSFIRWGPIKNYEFHEEKKVFCINDTDPEINLPHLYSDLLDWKTKYETYSCDFTNEYYHILLLIDLINLFVVADEKGLKKIFIKTLKIACNNENKKNMEKDFEEMIFVLEKLNLIKTRIIGQERFYLAINNSYFLEYAYQKGKESKKINETRVAVINEIYLNKSPLNKMKADIIRQEKKNGNDIENIQKKGAIYIDLLTNLSATLPFHYKFYEIDKKSGGRRTIAQPTEKLKNLQRSYLSHLEGLFPIHESAKAYRKNKNGILENIKTHRNSRYFYKFDFVDFFSSIKANDFFLFLQEKNYDRLIIVNLIKLFFTFKKSQESMRNKEAYDSIKSNQNNPDYLLNLYTDYFKNEFQLSIGAPSSPFISNIIMFDFDRKLTEWSIKNNICYSRYADDMTFSSNQNYKLEIIREKINDFLSEIPYLNMELNIKKERKCTFKQRVRITGLILTPTKSISIGRDKKKLIRAMINHFSLGKMEKDEIEKLKGWIAYCKDVEPKFYNTLFSKYSQNLPVIF
ncbi:retron St85 family RNA-directed DNA polymerase [Legionella sp. CNM-4043-24]|uniref:retron St85 family RNA-directed DNA polymerase n=1 Tax=Legionella sp. CNM-4043-24 TaxID=3421646 RepID=UPI00403AC616